MTPDGSDLFATGFDGEVARIDASDGSVVYETAETGTAKDAVAVGTPGGSGDVSGDVSGVVKTSDGSPVSNATVTVLGVNSSISIPDGSTYNQTAARLLDRASNPIPDIFERDQDFANLASEKSATQALVHKPSDWLDQSSGINIGGYQVTGDGDGISSPRHQVEPGEKHIVSCWDLSASDGFFADDLDSGWKGVTTDCTVNIERIGPDGSVINERSIESREMFETRLGLPGGKRHHAVAWTPAEPGIYRITVEGSPIETWVHAGDLRDLARTLEDDLKDKAGQYADRAKKLRQKYQDAIFVSRTTTTNATGHFAIDVPNGYQQVDVFAHKGTFNGETLQLGVDASNRSIAGMRAEWETRARDLLETAQGRSTTGAFADPSVVENLGSIYLQTEPTRVNVPDNDVTVRVREVSTPNFADPGITSNTTDLLNQWLGNMSYDELKSIFADQGLNISELETIEDRLTGAVEQNEELNQRLKEWEEQNADLREDTQKRIEFLEQLLINNGVTTNPENIEKNVGDAVENGKRAVDVVMTYPASRFGESFGTANWTVVAHDSDGNRRVIPNDAISVNRDRVRGLVELSVSDQLPNDVASTRYQVLGISANDVARTPVTVQTPGAAGRLPSLDSISVSSLRPGPNDEVDVQFNAPADSSFARISSATVILPDGSEKNVNTSGNAFSFQTEGAGDHVIEYVVENAQGSTYSDTLRVHAGKSDLPMPTGVRLQDTQFGLLAIGTDGVDAATLDLSEDRTTATLGIELGEDTPPGAGVHVYSSGALAGTSQTLNIRVLDETGQQVTKNVPITLHHDVLGEQTLFWINSDPVTPKNGKVSHGSNVSAVTSVQTITDKNGRLTIELNRDPGLLDRAIYRVEKAIAGIDLPTSPAQIPMPSLPMPVQAGLPVGIVAIGGIVRRRRGGRR